MATRSRADRVFGWFFRNRHTGQLTIAQFPNFPLGVFLAATAVDRLFEPKGTPGSGIGLLAVAALSWWAIDELLRGVNPWRRLLGGAVLAGQIVRAVAS